MKIEQSLAVTLLLACGAVMAGDSVTFYDDIRPIMEEKCLTCHTDQSVSFSFENPETAYSFHAAIAGAVEERRMPPWLPEPGHQRYADDISLTEREMGLIAQWAATGFAKGEARVERLEAVTGQAFDADLTIDVQKKGPYLPVQTRKDDYRCFLIDWPYQKPTFVTGFKAEPGNLRIAHHLVLFAVPPKSAEFLRMLSASEEGQGHQCFGGVLPDKLADNDSAREKLEASHPGQWRQLSDSYYWLSHWAPGMRGFKFPKDTGVLVEPGSVLVVQMHYYSAYAPGETDGSSRMQFQVKDSVLKPSINYPMTNGSWLNSDENKSMIIPAGKSRTYETSRNFAAIRDRASRILGVDTEAIDAIELRSANLHMHAFGASGRISLQKATGEKETLLSIPDWDIDWQQDFEFTEYKTINSGQFEKSRIIVECTFENYSDETVLGGYGSYDEMCFNFSYVSLVTKSGSAAAATAVAPP